jgi:hypothetical protein
MYTKLSNAKKLQNNNIKLEKLRQTRKQYTEDLPEYKTITKQIRRWETLGAALLRCVKRDKAFISGTPEFILQEKPYLTLEEQMLRSLGSTRKQVAEVIQDIKQNIASIE